MTHPLNTDFDDTWEVEDDFDYDDVDNDDIGQYLETEDETNGADW